MTPHPRLTVAVFCAIGYAVAFAIGFFNPELSVAWARLCANWQEIAAVAGLIVLTVLLMWALRAINMAILRIEANTWRMRRSNDAALKRLKGGE
jgi:hypothetical protein